MKTVLVKVQGALSFKAVEASDLAGVLKGAGVSSDYQATNVDTNAVMGSSARIEDGMRILLTLKTKGAC